MHSHLFEPEIYHEACSLFLLPQMGLPLLPGDSFCEWYLDYFTHTRMVQDVNELDEGLIVPTAKRNGKIIYQGTIRNDSCVDYYFDVRMQSIPIDIYGNIDQNEKEFYEKTLHSCTRMFTTKRIFHRKSLQHYEKTTSIALQPGSLSMRITCMQAQTSSSNQLHLESLQLLHRILNVRHL